MSRRPQNRSVSSRSRDRRRSASTHRGALPLGLRLPNGPAFFVGREAELDWLTLAIERAPVTVIWGLGGVGKTALALETVHRRFARQVDRTLFINAADTESGSLGAAMTRALATAADAGTLDLHELARDGSKLHAVALDLAESGSFWLLLDDLHRADPDEAVEVMTTFARYGRRARLLITTREHPVLDDLAGQVLSLGDMSEEELSTLGQCLRPGLDDTVIDEAVSSANGSPWRLLQVLAGNRPVRDSDDTLATIPEPARALLDILIDLRRPVDVATLASMATAFDDLHLDHLVRRGLVEVLPDGLRLHDVARRLVVDPFSRTDRGRLGQLSERLLQQRTPQALLEGIRLALLADRIDEAAAALDRGGRALVDAGYAPELWALLASSAEASLTRHRLLAAYEAGANDAFLSIADPERLPARLWLLRVRCLNAVGQIEAAAREATALMARARQEGLTEVLFEAGLTLARCAMNRGRVAEARTILTAMEPVGEGHRLRRDVTLLVIEATAGDAPRVMAGAHGMTARLLEFERRTDALDDADDGDDGAPSEADGPARRAVIEETAFEMARALFFVGALAQATEVLNRTYGGPGRRSLSRVYGRSALFLRCGLALDAGRLDDMQEIARRLWPHLMGPSLLRMALYNAEAIHALFVGELARLDALLVTAEAEAADQSWSQGIDMLEATKARLLLLRGGRARPSGAIAPTLAQGSKRAPTAVADEASAPATTGPIASPPTQFTVLADIYGARGSIRAGRGAPEPFELPATFARHPELGITQTLAQSEARLLAGDGEAAHLLAVRAEEGARTLGLALRVADALEVQAEVLVVTERLGVLVTVSARLAELGRAMHAPRLEREAEFYAAVGDRRVVPEQLERWADLEDQAPVVTRRARALLGWTPPLDRIDRAVVDRVSLGSALGCVEVRSFVGAAPNAALSDAVGDGVIAAPWRPAIGFDEVAGTLWFPDGRVVQMRTRPVVWRLLLALFEADAGALDKETLVESVWREDPYHPLRHDNRLHAAVRKVRALLEDDLTAPVHLVTTADGYALSGTFRRRRAREVSDRG